MTEKELLEKAAKATSRKRHPIISGAWSGDGLEEMRDSSMSIRVPTVWNPPDNDGDAFRLKFALRLEVIYTSQGCNVVKDDVLLAFEPWDFPKIEIERLAITRAAAAMADKE